MDANVVLALSMGFIWGALWALFIQFTRLGMFLAQRRAWITVAVGVGVDLLIALLVVPWSLWWRVALVIVLSGLPIVARSLANELSEQQDLERLVNGHQDAPGE